MSRGALIATGIYFAIAAAVIVSEAVSPPSSGWISFSHMGAFLVTFPVSIPLALINIEPDLDSKLNIAMLLASSTGVVYTVFALMARLFTSR